MHKVLILALMVIGATLLGGCETKPMQQIRQFFQSKGESELRAGIRNYEEGQLAAAADNFRDALRAGLNEADEVTANKYLAFIACSQKRERPCRAYFRRALELQPDFELTAFEAGHPMWGPTFRSLKKPR